MRRLPPRLPSADPLFGVEVPMSVLALSRLRRGAALHDVAFYDAADREVFVHWAWTGFASWPSFRANRRGLALLLRTDDVDVARRAMERVPSIDAALVTYDLLRLHDFDGWKP